MAIPPYLRKFKNEKEFTEGYLMPLVRQLGFTVTLYHGKREFGRDLIFAEIDRLGHVVYHGLQAKFTSTVSQSQAHKLVEDCDEAFSMPFVYPETGQKHYISRFYIVNGGTISDNARELVFKKTTSKYGGNVVVLDGIGIESLKNAVQLRKADFVRPKFVSVIDETAHNAGCLKAMLEHEQTQNKKWQLGEFNSFYVFRMQYGALLSFISEPVTSRQSILTGAIMFYERLRRINYLLDTADIMKSQWRMKEAVREATNAKDECIYFSTLLIELVTDTQFPINLSESYERENGNSSRVK